MHDVITHPPDACKTQHVEQKLVGASTYTRDFIRTHTRIDDDARPSILYKTQKSALYHFIHVTLKNEKDYILKAVATMLGISIHTGGL